MQITGEGLSVIRRVDGLYQYTAKNNITRALNLVKRYSNNRVLSGGFVVPTVAGGTITGNDHDVCYSAGTALQNGKLLSWAAGSFVLTTSSVGNRAVVYVPPITTGGSVVDVPTAVPTYYIVSLTVQPSVHKNATPLAYITRDFVPSLTDGVSTLAIDPAMIDNDARATLEAPIKIIRYGFVSK